MSTNAYWLDEKFQLKIGKKSIAYGEEIPEAMMKKIHPATLDKLRAENKIGSMPKPGRLPGSAEHLRKIKELEDIVVKQKKQAALVPGLQEELGKTKDALGEIAKKLNGQMNGLKVENDGLREQLETKDKEITSMKESADKVESLEKDIVDLKASGEDKDKANATLKESVKILEEDKKALQKKVKANG